MIISVASGKGGTGKTLVATSLALSLGKHVQIVDCDVEEPNVHVLLQPTITQSKPVCILVPRVDKIGCNYCGECAKVCVYKAIAVVKDIVLVFPELCHGCGACSYLCPQKVISEEGREIGIVETGYCGEIDFVQGKLNIGEAMAPPVIREVKQLVNRKKTAIIDASPGTSCPVVEAVRGSDFCLLVTEPTPFGLHDLSLAVDTVKALGISCGIVLNRAGGTYSKVEEYCVKENIPLLLKIPLDREIARLYSNGITLVKGVPEWCDKFKGLFHNIEQIVAANKQVRT
ncbi:MAG TPA: ATP-binding protein [Dehalococcoidia bacterium]|nr:ATP-binding protein [Dehalococcoidia bacterium]